MKNLTKSVLIATAIAAAGFSASAQAMMGGSHGPMGEMGHKGQRDPARMEQMMARHLDTLKAALKLSPAQEAAWTTFAASMKPAKGAMPKRPDMAELQKLPTPERLDKMSELHKQHRTEMDAAMAQRNEAIKTFYASLSPEQKKTFDADHARMEGGRHGKGSGPMQGMPGMGPQAKP